MTSVEGQSSDEGVCPQCSSSSIEVEQGQCICSNCGLILRKSALQDSYDPTGTLYTTTSHFFSGQISLPRGVQRSFSESKPNRNTRSLLQFGKIIGQYLMLCPSDLNKLESILKKMLCHQHFKKRTIAYKKILVAVCSYVLALQSGSLVTMNCLCERVQCKIAEFKKVLNLFLSLMPDLKPHFRTLSEWVPFFMNQAKFPDEIRSEVEERATAIINLLSLLEITDGQRPQHLVTAVLYIAWKSLNPKERSSTILSRFCIQYQLESNQNTSKKVHNLLDIFTKMSYYLPWLNSCEKRNPIDSLLYIPDLINHSLLISEKYKSDNKKSQPEVEIQETSNLVEYFKKNGPPDAEDVDPEISDGEIENYIRTEREVSMLQAFMNGPSARDKSST